MRNGHEREMEPTAHCQSVRSARDAARGRTDVWHRSSTLLDRIGSVARGFAATESPVSSQRARGAALRVRADAVLPAGHGPRDGAAAWLADRDHGGPVVAVRRAWEVPRVTLESAELTDGEFNTP